eukprot:m.116075 g.116075  ORF g.116075 m.116075 type:complete len:458 (+) comp14460_c0_seq5:124-1497(+)
MIPRLVPLLLWVALVSSEQTPTLLHEWASLDYTWDATHVRQEYISNGWFVPENCALAGIKAFNNSLYVTVPRWFHGVPATLAKVVTVNGASLLQPFPDWEWQNVSQSPPAPAALWYVQSMEVTPAGVMWILDVGRLNIFDAPQYVVNGPPRLVLFDLTTNTALHTFIFPNNVASYTHSFLNDLALDIPRGFAYISDTLSGAIVVYSRATNSAWRLAGRSTQSIPNFNFTVNNVSYPSLQNTAVDGIALAPDCSRLYYCAVDGDTMYSVATAVLQAGPGSLDGAARNEGSKAPSDGLGMTRDGHLYFGSIARSELLVWDTARPFASASVVYGNTTTMQWQDTFAFDAAGTLYLVTNRLQLFFTKTMDFAQINFRIFAFPAVGQSYLFGEPPVFGPASTASGSTYTTRELAGGIIGGFFLGLLLASIALFLITRHRRRTHGLAAPLHDESFAYRPYPHF